MICAVCRPGAPSDVPAMVALAASAGLMVDAPMLLGALADAAVWWWVATVASVVQGGFLARFDGDEVEVYDLVVAQASRRLGLGVALVGALTTQAREVLAKRIVLEVACDNTAALALYARSDFIAVGRRPAYYARPAKSASDAIIMAKVVL